MQTLKQKGFTLIELLVVIVIIGILATISVATFSGYFQKARDSERQAAVRNAATILKTGRAVETITSFEATGATGLLATPTGTVAFPTFLSNEGGYAIPNEGSFTNNEYLYIWGDATTAAIQGEEFAIFACSEETATAAFVDGTTAGVTAANASLTDLCDDANARVAADLADGNYSYATVSNGGFTPAP